MFFDATENDSSVGSTISHASRLASAPDGPTETDFLSFSKGQRRARSSAIVGESPALQTALSIVRKVAPTSASVLVLGETGTGKELFAREIHRLSARNEKPLVSVNCASIPNELFESEFFGHVAGAFTGASRNRAGRFELANGGSIFLDEICEIPLNQQGKLLRVLQEKEFERVGDTKTKVTNVRLIAATNRDPLNEIQKGEFREDLYYRLNVVPIIVPPLRERAEDVLLLAKHLLRSTCEHFGRGPFKLDAHNKRALLKHSWPGNVRELRNVMERAVALSALRLMDLEELIGFSEPNHGRTQGARYLTEQEFVELERRNIIAALEVGLWRISGSGGAADLLGIPPSTLANRIKKLGISKHRPGNPVNTQIPDFASIHRSSVL